MLIPAFLIASIKYVPYYTWTYLLLTLSLINFDGMLKYLLILLLIILFLKNIIVN